MREFTCEINESDLDLLTDLLEKRITACTKHIDACYSGERRADSHIKAEKWEILRDQCTDLIVKLQENSI